MIVVDRQLPDFSEPSVVLRVGLHRPVGDDPQRLLPALRSAENAFPGRGHLLFPVASTAQQRGTSSFTELYQEIGKALRVKLWDCRFLPRQVRRGEHLLVASGV